MIAMVRGERGEQGLQPAPSSAPGRGASTAPAPGSAAICGARRSLERRPAAERPPPRAAPAYARTRDPSRGARVRSSRVRAGDALEQRNGTSGSAARWRGGERMDDHAAAERAPRGLVAQDEAVAAKARPSAPGSTSCAHARLLAGRSRCGLPRSTSRAITSAVPRWTRTRGGSRAAFLAPADLDRRVEALGGRRDARMTTTWPRATPGRSTPPRLIATRCAALGAWHVVRRAPRAAHARVPAAGQHAHRLARRRSRRPSPCPVTTTPWPCMTNARSTGRRNGRSDRRRLDGLRAGARSRRAERRGRRRSPSTPRTSARPRAPCRARGSRSPRAPRRAAPRRRDRSW